MPVPMRPAIELPLPRKFDDEIGKQKAQQAAEIGLKIEHIKDRQEDLKAAAKALDKDIKMLELQRAGLDQDTRTGVHAVPILCNWIMDTSEWTLYAGDNGEVVRREPTNAADRQLLLGNVGGARKPEPKPESKEPEQKN